MAFFFNDFFILIYIEMTTKAATRLKLMVNRRNFIGA